MNCVLACVEASTLKPYVERQTMLDERRSGDFSRFALFEGRQDVDLTHDITVRLKPTGRAAVNAPPWFVSILAIGASLTGVVFVYQNDGDALGLGLVFYE